MSNLFSKIYRQCGNGAAQTVVMLHGWGLNHAVWAQTAAALSETAEVHCLDLPGHGKSPLLDAYRRPTIGLLQHIIEEIGTYISSVGKPVTLIGWSLGGHIAMYFAMQHPALISKLVLISATPCFGERDDWPHAMAQKSLTDFSQRLQTNQAATIRSFLCLQMLNLPNAKSVAQVLAKQLAAHGEASAEALKIWLDVLEQSDVRDEISKLLETPMLIVQGGRDMLVPSGCGDWLTETLPHAQYVCLEAAAHAPFISHEAVFITALSDFLNNEASIHNGDLQPSPPLPRMSHTRLPRGESGAKQQLTNLSAVDD